MVEGYCDRCGKKEKATFIFYEVDSQDRKHRFGFFCRQCTTERIDKLRGKLEWFPMEEGWRGYILTKARSQLENGGFIHSEYDPQFIEIKKVGGNQEPMRKENLAVLRMEYAAGLISQQEYRRRLAHR